MRDIKKLSAALLNATSSLSGGEQPTVIRGRNMVLRGGIDGQPYFECFEGNLDLGENYDLDTADTKQKIRLTVLGAVTADGNAKLTLTAGLLDGTPLVIRFAVLNGDTAAQVATKAIAAIAANAGAAAFFSTAGSAGAAIDLEVIEVDTNDSTMSAAIDNDTCTGLTPATSVNVTAGVVGCRLTGTISVTAGSTQVDGAGTSFLNELHIGQIIQTNGGQPICIKEIASDTLAYAERKLDSAEAAVVARRLPQLSEVNRQRAVSLTGNVIQFENGHYIGAGSGELFINGSPLAGRSMMLKSRPRTATYRPTTDDYDVNGLGFDDAPTVPTIDVIAGGTGKLVSGNKHSFMFAWWCGSPEGTNGYSNPSDQVKFKADGVTALQLSAANQKFEVDFTSPLAGRVPNNARGFIIFGSLAGKKQTSTQGATVTTTDPNIGNYENGPWYEVEKVLFTDLDGSNKYSFEYGDGDVTGIVTGDNFRPPHCEFVAKIEGKPMYISANGKSRVGREDGANPGPSVVCSKFANPDGAPPDWKADLLHTIIGWFEGVGRWFLITPSSLDFVASTGLLGQSFQGTLNLELPILARPYWQTGAANRYSITMIDDTIVGFSGRKPVKSIGQGDENVTKYEFGGVIEDLTRFWYSGHVYTVRDPKNTQAVFVHTAQFKNAAGYWCSVLQPYSLFRNAWLPAIVLSSDTQDMIVSGVAVVDERFEFLAGGRKSGGSWQTRTYRFDEADATLTSMPWYVAWQLSDDGLQDVAKMIHSLQLTGRVTNCKIQVHGMRPGGTFNISDLEDGVNSLSGDIVFADSDEITSYLKKKFKVKNLANYCLRISGDWDGVGDKDRIDELAVEISTHGKQR